MEPVDSEITTLELSVVVSYEARSQYTHDSPTTEVTKWVVRVASAFVEFEATYNTKSRAQEVAQHLLTLDVLTATTLREYGFEYVD